VKPRLEVLLTPDVVKGRLADDVRAGLSGKPRSLPFKWLYDERGSDLFEAITQLPDYYLSRTEYTILDEHAPSIAGFSEADTVIELGSGSSARTRLLLDAFRDRRQLRRFVPFDASEAALRGALASLGREYPTTEIHGIVGDFDHHLDALPGGGRRLVAFLGSTLCNLEPAPRGDLLARLSEHMETDDALLLGTDLAKNPAVILAAYDDPGGVTADFNRNVLRVVNRELHADFVPSEFDHVVRWNPERSWIEMLLRSRRPQEASVRDLGLEITLEEHEEIHTEISAKVDRNIMEADLAAAKFELARWWTDAGGSYAVSLSFRT